MLIGIILLALGLSLAVVWNAQVLQALQGLLPLGLLFFGVIVLLVGYSERKAAREYKEAISDDEASEPRRRR
jgi:hypothetical protein